MALGKGRCAEDRHDRLEVPRGGPLDLRVGRRPGVCRISRIGRVERPARSSGDDVFPRHRKADQGRAGAAHRIYCGRSVGTVEQSRRLEESTRNVGEGCAPAPAEPPTRCER